MDKHDPSAPRPWHHAPTHHLSQRGAYMVTCGTLGKVFLLDTDEKREEFLNLLFKYADKFGWRLQAWAVLGNHYHWIGDPPEAAAEDARSLRTLTAQLHEVSTKRLNRRDGTPGRRVWFNYWESRLTHPASYYARLKYVHDNPAHHGVVANAANYRWCSRPWLEQTADRAFIRELDSFKTDRLQVQDDF